MAGPRASPTQRNCSSDAMARSPPMTLTPGRAHGGRPHRQQWYQLTTRHVTVHRRPRCRLWCRLRYQRRDALKNRVEDGGCPEAGGRLTTSKSRLRRCGRFRERNSQLRSSRRLRQRWANRLWSSQIDTWCQNVLSCACVLNSFSKQNEQRERRDIRAHFCDAKNW